MHGAAAQLEEEAAPVGGRTPSADVASGFPLLAFDREVARGMMARLPGLQSPNIQDKAKAEARAKTDAAFLLLVQSGPLAAMLKLLGSRSAGPGPPSDEELEVRFWRYPSAALVLP